MTKRLAAAIVLAILAAALTVWLVQRKTAPEPGTIKLSGTVEVTTVDASFKLPGRVKERLVDEGMVVKAGQVLALLENDDQSKEVAIREAEAQASGSLLLEAERGSRKEEVGRAEAAVAAAEAESRRLAVDFQRQEALYRKEVIARRELDAARSARDVTQAKAREIRETLMLVRKGPRREQIEQLRARKKAADATLDLARTRLGYTTLTSPLAGRILSKNVEAGEQVAAGTPVVTIGDFGSTWVRGYISETDLGRTKVGQKVRVTSDTWPGKIYHGTVSFIGSEAEFTPKNVQTEKERVKLVYRVKVAIANPAMELKPGMPVDAEIGPEP